MHCSNSTINLFWFRRDLRINDNHGLQKALSTGKTICCFIWDIEKLDSLNKDNPRVIFIEKSLAQLKIKLQEYGSDLIICYAKTSDAIISLSKQHQISSLYFNEDYEPSAIKRDMQIIENLKPLGIATYCYKDQVIFHKTEILNKENKPYNVFSAYKRAWLSRIIELDYQDYNTTKYLHNLAPLNPQNDYYQPSQTSFIANLTISAGEKSAEQRLQQFINNIDEYDLTRNFPNLDSTSYLGVDLRFGTISIRQLVRVAIQRKTNGAEIWLSELIWRDFFSQILYNYPYVVKSSFNRRYTNLAYENNLEWFDKWCNAETGYPIIDAAMRQLNQTGFMHNRLRMVCASFLCKDLLVDWRWGEQYFAKKLLDYDLASNNGNWQWCASTGCDAQPYFRVFNPYLQSKKFDEAGDFIRQYIPELAHLNNKEIHTPNIDIFNNLNYPTPIIEHKPQSQKAIAMFKFVDYSGHLNVE